MTGDPEQEREKQKSFVDSMLEKADKDESEPKPNTAEEDQKEIESITDRIRRKIQGD
ncbi:MAG: hypothetical protein R6U32_05050 [Candidatus Woesearchaeota archaeon]